MTGEVRANRRGWDGWMGWMGKTDQVPHRETGRDLGFSLERMTGLEPATSTLARLRSTN